MKSIEALKEELVDAINAEIDRLEALALSLGGSVPASTSLPKEVRKAFTQVREKTTRRAKRVPYNPHGGDAAVWPMITAYMEANGNVGFTNKQLAAGLSLPVSTVAYYMLKHRRKGDLGMGNLGFILRK